MDNKYTKFSKETLARHEGWITKANLTEKNSKKAMEEIQQITEASILEEPGAGNSHAGICAGYAG